MGVEETVREYYGTLRRGEPLYPFFAERSDVVKFGIGERLTGYDEIATGLREQTRTTENWTVESRNLRATERERHGWFSDDVRMAWRDVSADREYDFQTRWSGTLEAQDDGEWAFVGMHVSCPTGASGD
jgi:hypothetical protein